MAKMGGSRHLKTIAAPRSWPVPRKSRGTWIPKPRGGHPLDGAMPLITVLEVLGIGRDGAERRKVIKAGQILVDGRRCTDPKRAIGFMDVISIPALNKNYRTIYDHRRHIVFAEIPAEQAAFKLCQVKVKKTVKGGRIQITTHDGRTFLNGDAKCGDVVRIELPAGDITERYPLEKGAIVYVVRGKHAGRIGQIVKIEKGTATRKASVRLEIDGKEVETTIDCVFPIGSEQNMPGEVK